MAASQEDCLIQQLDALTDDDRSALHAWYKAAYAHMRACDHWWCQHTRVMYGLAKVMSYEAQPVVILIWDEMSRQLSRCDLCIKQYHIAQASYASEGKTQVLLEVMARRDAERVAGWLQAGMREVEKQQQQQLEEGDEPPQQVDLGDILKKLSLAIIEALSHPSVLADAEVMSRLVAVLQTNCWDTSVTDELINLGPKPGLFQLAAHPDTAVRDLVIPAIEVLKPFATWEDAGKASLDTVLAQWAPPIRQAVLLPFHGVDGAEESKPALASLVGPGGRPLFIPPLESLLVGLKMLLKGLQPPAMAATVVAFPDLPVSLIAHVLAWRRDAPSYGGTGTTSASAAAAPVAPPPGLQHLLECLVSLAGGLEGEDLRAACTAAAGCYDGEVDGVAALTAALTDAALSTSDSSLRQSIIKLCGQLLCTFACDRRAPVLDLRRLLAFLVRHVHGSFFLPFGGGAQYESLCRTTAALEAFNGVAIACCQGGCGTAFASDLYGQAASQAVMALAGPVQSSGAAISSKAPHSSDSLAVVEARMVEAAADALCLVLQADATALAAVLEPSNAWSQKICPSVAEVLYNPFDDVRTGLPLASPSADTPSAAAAAVCEQAINQLDSYRCTPAAYLAVAGCPHPAVALALILAAGHCAELEYPPAAADHSQLATAGSIGSGPGGHASRVAPAATALQSVSFIAAAQWPVRPRPEGPNDCAVPVRQCSGLLLKQLRQAAVVHLQNAAREAHVLGIAADRLPKVEGVPREQREAAAAVAMRVDGAALGALLRLVCGPHAELSAAAEDALVSHYLLPERVSEARAEAIEPGDWGGALQLAMREGWLLPSQNQAGVVLNTCTRILDDLAAVGPVDKLMSSSRLAPTLNCIKAVLYACSGHQRLDEDAWALAHRTWALLVYILEKGLAAFRDRPDCRSGLAPLVALMPICWFYLLQVAPEGRGPTPRLMRAWLPAALRWVPVLAEASGGPMCTCAVLLSSLESMMATVRDNGPLSQDVLAAAREALSPGNEILDGELRLRLTGLFPELTSATNSHSTHVALVIETPGPRPPVDKVSRVDVVDLTLSDNDEGKTDEEGEEEEEEEEAEDDGVVVIDVDEALEDLEWEGDEMVASARSAAAEEVAALVMDDASKGPSGGDKVQTGEAGQTNIWPSAAAAAASVAEPSSQSTRRVASVAAAMRAAAALHRAGVSPGAAGNTNNPFAVPLSEGPAEESRPPLPPPPPPQQQQQRLDASATSAVSPSTITPTAAAGSARPSATGSAAGGGSKAATVTKEEFLESLKALEAAVLRAARSARSHGGQPTTRVGSVDLPQAYRFLSKFKPSAMQNASDAGAGPGAVAKVRKRPTNANKAERTRKELLLGLGGRSAVGRGKGRGGGGSGSGGGGLEGGMPSRGWAVGSSGHGSRAAAAAAAGAMPLVDPLLQQPMPTLRAQLQQQRAAAAAAAAAAEKPEAIGKSGGGASKGGDTVTAAPANAGVTIIDDEDLATPAAGRKTTGTAAGLQKPRLGLGLGLGLAAAAGRTVGRSVVLLETSGLRTSNTAKALPKLEVLLHMSDVVRQVLQIPMDVLFPDPGDRASGLAARRSALERLAVPISFDSLDVYTDIFRALLMEELTASVRSSIEEMAAAGGGGPGAGATGSEPPSVVGIVESISRIDDLRSVKFRVESCGPRKEICRLDDFVLITSKPLPDASAVAQPPKPCVLAVVRETALDKGCSIVTVQICANQACGGTLASMLPQTRWHFTVLKSLVTNFREFAALCNLPRLYAPMVHFLLKPEPAAISTTAGAASWDAACLPPPLKAGLATAFNDSQRKAILSALDASLFTLVQGPPGTGKTSAIMGIVSVLLARRDISDYKAALAAGVRTKYDGWASGAAAGAGGRIVAPQAATAGSGRDAKLVAIAAAVFGPTRAAAAACSAEMGPLKKSSAARRFEAMVAAKAAGAEATGSGPTTEHDGLDTSRPGATLRDLHNLPPAKQQRLSGSADAAALQQDLRSRSSNSSSGATEAAPAAAAAECTRKPAVPQEALDAFDFSTEPRCRILVCAQSNAAIDELLTRLALEGVWRADGRRKPPAVARLGRVEVAHESVHALHVDSLAEQLAGRHGGTVEASANLENARREVSEAQMEHDEVKHELHQLRLKLNELLESQKQQLAQQARPRSGSDGGSDDSNGGGGADDAEGMDLCGSETGTDCEPEGGERRRRQKAPDANKTEHSDSAARDGGGRNNGVADSKDVDAMKGQLRVLEARERQLYYTLKEAKNSQFSRAKNLERQRKEIRQAIVKAAEVVVTTLSSAGGELASLWSSLGATAPAPALAALGRTGSAVATAAAGGGGGNGGSRGGGLLSKPHPFDALIIDEAAQALEPAALIPLQLLKPSAKVVLVGDPRQLPPTVLSRAADAARLSQSLFERLQLAGCQVSLLSRQYRMHPAISRFPSSFFYNGELLDGETVTTASRSAPCHMHPLFGPLVVYDCAGRMEQGSSSGRSGSSLLNPIEAELVAELYTGLRTCFPDYRPRVAILTPYRAQLTALRRALRKALGKAAVSEAEMFEGIDLATVDGYQGREADVVIFSTVRAKPPALSSPSAGVTSSLGFLNDVRRMNVAMTRARQCLWVVGHATTLAGSPPWLALLRHVVAHGSLMSVRSRINDMLNALPDRIVESCRISEAALDRMLAGHALPSSGGGRTTTAAAIAGNERGNDRPPRPPGSTGQARKPNLNLPHEPFGPSCIKVDDAAVAAPGRFGISRLAPGRRHRSPEPCQHPNQPHGVGLGADGRSGQQPELQPRASNSGDAPARIAEARPLAPCIHGARATSDNSKAGSGSGTGKRSAELDGGPEAVDALADQPRKRLAVQGADGAPARSEAGTISGTGMRRPVCNVTAHPRESLAAGVMRGQKSCQYHAALLTAATAAPMVPGATAVDTATGSANRDVSATGVRNGPGSTCRSAAMNASSTATTEAGDLPGPGGTWSAPNNQSARDHTSTSATAAQRTVTFGGGSGSAVSGAPYSVLPPKPSGARGAAAAVARPAGAPQPQPPQPPSSPPLSSGLERKVSDFPVRHGRSLGDQISSGDSRPDVAAKETTGHRSTSAPSDGRNERSRPRPPPPPPPPSGAAPSSRERDPLGLVRSSRNYVDHKDWDQALVGGDAARKRTGGVAGVHDQDREKIEGWDYRGGRGLARERYKSNKHDSDLDRSRGRDRDRGRDKSSKDSGREAQERERSRTNTEGMTCRREGPR